MTQSVSNDPDPSQAESKNTETVPDADATALRASETAESKGVPNAKPKSPLWWWLLGIACVLGIELFIYGHNGWVRVCVGLQGVTDLTLLDRPKHRDGMKGFPICAEQLNLGMYSRSEDAAREALELACARGAPLLQGVKQECLRKDHGWIRRVDKTHIPPWDQRLYRRLLFLD